jgi:hypothetical protein
MGICQVHPPLTGTPRCAGAPRLIVLVGSEINLGVGDPYDRLNDASRAGGVVGAQLLLQ